MKNYYIISAHKHNCTVTENYRRHKDLATALLHYDFTIRSVKGRFCGKAELSFIIEASDVTPRMVRILHDLAKRYEQECWLFVNTSEQRAYFHSENKIGHGLPYTISTDIKLNNGVPQDYTRLGDGRYLLIESQVN